MIYRNKNEIMQIHRKNTSALIDRLILSFGFVLLLFGSSISNVRAEPYCYGEVDLVFVVDASYSYSKTDFDIVREFVVQLYSSILDNGGDGGNLHAGVVLYASHVYDDDRLILLGNSSNMLVPRLTGFIGDDSNIFTNTSEGLSVMLDMFRDEGRQGSTKVGILITDGISDEPDKTREIAATIKADLMDIFMIAVGVGTKETVDINELRAIAANNEHAIIQSNLIADYFLEKLLKKVCAETLDKKSDPEVEKESLAMDVVFMIPESVLDLDFDICKDFVETVMRRFEMSSAYARVGIIKFGQDVLGPQHYIQLNQFNREDNFFAAFDNMRRNAANERGNAVHRALETLNQWMDRLTNSPRPVAAVLLTPGSASEVELAVQQAELLMYRVQPKVYLIVFGIGTNTALWESERNRYAHSQAASFYTENFLGIAGTTDASIKLIDDFAATLSRIGSGTFDSAGPGTIDRWDVPFDVLFTLDGSKIVSSAAFQISLIKFVIKELIDEFELTMTGGSTGGRVGVMLYDAAGVYNRISLGDYTSREDLVTKIDRLAFIQRTETADNALALEAMRKYFDASPREPAAQVGYLITMSTSGYPLLARSEAQVLATEGIQLIVVGVGDAVSQEELNSLQVFEGGKGPVTYSPVFQLTSTSTLDELRSDLQKYAAINRPTGNIFRWAIPFDMIILLHDESGREGQGINTKYFVQDICSRHNIGPDNVQCGVLTFGETLNTGANEQIVLGSKSYLGQLTVSLFQLSLVPTGGVNIEAAVDGMRDMFTQYGRQGVPKVVLLITQGISLPDSLNDKIEDAKNDGIKFATIGIGAETQSSFIKQVASNQELGFIQSSWSTVEWTTEMDAGLIALATDQFQPQGPGDILKLQTQCSLPAAIVVVIDASESMSDIFDDVKDFSLVLMSGFEIPTVKIGALAFAANVIQDSLITPGQVNSYIELYVLFNDNVNIATQQGFSTRTDSAISRMTEWFSRITDVDEKIAVIVTDGKSDNPASTQVQGSIARNAGINIIAIGVDVDDFTKNELIGLTDNEDRLFSFTGDDFKDREKLQIVQEKICTLARPGVCEPGNYRDADLTCQPCGVGTYQSGPEELFCSLCPAGKTTEDPGSASEENCIMNCPPGTRINGDDCEECPIGQYQDESAQLSCKSCPPDKNSTPFRGTTSVDQCTADICGIDMDLIVLFDGSSSISVQNFANTKTFIIRQLPKFVIGQDRTRVGVMRIGEVTNLEDVFSLTNSNSESDVINAILDLKGGAASSNIASAMSVARQEFAENSRPNVPTVLLLMVDSISEDPGQIEFEAMLAQQAGYVVVALGLNDSISEQELQNIAPGNVLIQPDFGALASVDLSPLICSAASQYEAPDQDQNEDCSSKMELMFILDLSDSTNGLIILKAGLVEFLDVFPEISPIAVRIGLFSYASSVHVNRSLPLFADADKTVIKDKIQVQIKQDVSSTDTSGALNYAMTELLESRPDVPRVVIIFTDGVSTDSKATKATAQELRDKQIFVLAVSYGNAFPYDTGLKDIATTGADAVIKFNSVALPTVFVETLKNKLCIERYMCSMPLDIVYIWDLKSDSLRSDDVAKFTAGISERFSAARESLIRVGPGGAVSLEEAITDGRDILALNTAPYKVAMILIISDKDLPVVSTSLRSAATVAKQQGVKISVINAGQSPDENWANVTSGLTNVYQDYFLDSFHLAWYMCLEPCSNGNEIKENGQCEPCEKGYYRDGTTYQCIACDGTTTTNEIGSSSPTDCIIAICEIPMDLFLLIDASDSIGTRNFGLLKATIWNFIDKFPVGLGDDQTRIAYVTIGESVTEDSYTRLRDSTSGIAVQTKIVRIPGGELQTNTAAAISKMSEIFREEGRPNVPKVSLSITDGISINRFQTKRQSALAHLEGISMVSIGVSDKVNMEEINAIASTPEDALTFATFDDLFNSNTLHLHICDVAKNYKPPDTIDPTEPLAGDCPTRMDLVFGLDASTAVQEEDFLLMKVLITNTIQRMDIGSDKIRVGILSYSNVVHEEEILNLENSNNELALRESISSQEQKGSPGRDTARALGAMIDMFTAASNARTDVARVAVLIKGGQTGSLNDLRARAEQAKNEGIHVITFGFGDESQAMKDELEIIATDPDSAIHLPNFSDLQIDDLIKLTCPGYFQCSAPMDICITWDLSGIDSITRAEKFMGILDKEFTSTSFTSVYIDHVDNIAIGVRQCLDQLLASEQTHATRSLLIFTDKPLPGDTKDLLQAVTNDANTNGILSFVVDANANVLEDTASSRKLSFNTDKFDVLPHTTPIKQSLCVAPCEAGHVRIISSAGIKCEPCPANSYRDPAETFGCTGCPGMDMTSGPGSTSKQDCRVGACATAMDIAFVIDASESISPFEFNALLRAFLTNTLSGYDIGLHRVALILFSSDVFLSQVFDLDSSTDKEALLNAVAAMTQERRGSGTNTAKAIETAVDMMTLQGRSDTLQTVVVLTDGISDNRYRTFESSRKAKKNHVRVIGLGVGPNVFEPEIKAIASRDSYRIINSFPALAGTMDFLDFTCEDTYICTKSMDIVIFEDKTTTDLLFTVKLASFGSKLNESYSSNVEAIEYYSQNDLEIKIDNNALPKFISNTQNAKVFLFITKTNIDRPTTKAKINSLKARGGVVALIKANLLLDNKDFSSIVSNGDFLFETDRFNMNPSVRHIERELCIDACMDGYERVLDGSCQKCQLGFIKTAADSNVCLPCPEGKTTREEGTVDVSMCIPNCGPGTYTVGDSCQDCPMGEYQPGQFQTDCLQCPDDLTTATMKTTSINGCIVNCGPGTRRSTDGESCVPCPLDFYNPDSHQTSCIACPINLKTSGEASTSLADCQGDCSLKMDVIFILDASTSVKLVELQLIKAFIINTITRFVVSQMDTRFGIITFANDVIPDPQLQLSESTSREAAINVARILIQGQEVGTNMQAAFRAARDMFADQGLPGRPRRVVMITDGIANDKESAESEAAILKSEYVHITCIGVGPRAYLPLLRNVATNPDEVISEVSFAVLATKDILPNICGETCEIGMDVYFINHFNGNPVLTDRVNAFKTDMANKFPITNIINIPAASTLIESLNLLLTEVDANPGDPTFTKSVVISTNQPNTEDVMQTVQAVKDAGLIVSVIYISNDMSDQSYNDVVSESDLLFFAEDFDISPYSEYILRALCIAPCELGSQRNSDGVCSECERGYFRSADELVCVACPPAKTTNNVGASSFSECIDCQPENWLCADGVTCIPLDEQCDDTDDCPDGSDEVCNDCDVGTSWNGAECVPCPKGTFQDSPQQTSCTLCPTGSSTPGEGTTTQSGCDINCDQDGEELNSVGTGCVPCPIGKFRNVDRHLVCVDCPANFTTVNIRSISELDCVPDCDEGEAFIDNQCELCPANTIQPDKHQRSCLPCPDGLSSPPGGVSCTNECPVAGQQYDYDTSSCVNCPLDTFATADMTNCQSCPDNHITLNNGSTSITACLPDCIPGRYWNEVLETCTPCDKGEFVPFFYQTECLSCPIGKSTETTGSASIDDCLVPCNLGEEVIVSTGGCKLCDIGYYREERDDISCTRCLDGETTEFPGTDSIALCFPICRSGSKRVGRDCVPCEIGTWQPESGQTECILCPEGLSTLTTGSNTVDRCLDLCGSGTQMTNKNPVECTLCPFNSYRQQYRNRMCVSCDPFITLSVGAEHRRECLPDCTKGESWNPFIGQCDKCNVGAFGPLPNQLFCIACPEGWTTDGVGKTSFDDCLPDCSFGRRWDSTTLGCVDCGLGFYQPNRFQLFCFACANGTTTSTTTATQETQCQDPCPGGEELPDGGTSSVDCVPCPLNTQKDPSMDTRCQYCPPGFITVSTGRSSLSDCIPNCDAGTRFDTTLKRCVDCERGTFQIATSQSTCNQCQPSGFTTLDPGANSPVLCVSPCFEGFKWFGGRCVPCAVGEYQDQANQINCISCGNGQTTDGPQSDSPDDCIDTGCTTDEFECDNGDCIPLIQRCDESPDCVDGSDEGFQCPGQCPPGDRVVDDDCEACPIGTYQEMANKDFCTPCTNGRFTAQSGSTSETLCIECPAGQQFTQGQSGCTPCPIDQYKPQGLPSCMQCPPGFVTVSTGTPSLDGCLPDCPDSTYYDGSECVECPIGEYQDDSNQRECKQCPNRRITPQVGADEQSDCVDCEAGSDFTPGDTLCKPCDVNYYKSGSRCVRCPAGFVTLTTGGNSLSDCIPNCPPGYFYPDVTIATCTKCPRGQYQLSWASDSCDVCEPGTTTIEDGAITIDLCLDLCPSGTEWDADQEVCLSCPQGSHKEKGRHKTCQECENDYTTPSTRATSSAECVPDCLKGEYWTGTACMECPPGFYQDLEHQTSCIRCPAGTFVAQFGATSRFQCIEPCGDGAEIIYNNFGSFRCIPCPRGQAKARPQLVCTDCPPGTVTLGTGATVCVADCDSGSYYDGQTCKLCPRGTYQPDRNMESCIACDVGKYTRDEGANNITLCIDICPSGTELQFDGTCQECRMNYFRTQNKGMRCEPCPGPFFTLTIGSISIEECLPPCIEGTYWDGVECSPCLEGQYQDRDHQRECVSCGDGQTTLDSTKTVMVTGATSQDQCHANCQEGEMVMEGTTNQCVSCPKMTYQYKKYQDKCINCPLGKTTIDVGSKTILDCYDPCENGRTFNPVTGLCEPCGFNRYRDRSMEGHNLCLDCPTGQITITDTAAECIDTTCNPGSVFDGLACVPITCDPGQFISSTFDCTDCAEGSYQNGLSERSCNTCPAGTTSSAGSTLLIHCTDPCPDGEMLPPTGLSLVDCVPCLKGWYKNAGETTVCVQCSTGFTTATTSSTRAEDCIRDCKAGRKITSSGCDPCELATFQGNDLQSSCNSCPEGQTTDQIGSTSPTDCKDRCNNGFELGTDKQTCMVCAKGTYREKGTDAMCRDCPPGFTTETIASPNSDSCVRDCMKGEGYNDITGQCEPCGIGFYQPNPYREECFPCPSWKTTLSIGSDSFDLCIDPCSDGLYRDVNGDCLLCPRNSYRQQNIHDSCQNCSFFFVTLGEGSISIRECFPDCPPGTHWDELFEDCTPCELNTFNKLPYQFECFPCPPEYPLSEDDRLDCRKQCPPGEIWNRQRKACNWCAKGQYKPTDTTGCINCPDFQTTLSAGTNAVGDCIPDCSGGQLWVPSTLTCDDCQPGTFQDASNPHSETTCKTCPGDNMYQPMAGQNSCLTCADGMVATNSKQSCKGTCNAGQFWSEADGGCEPCPKKTYQETEGSQEVCVSCPAGLHTISTGSTSLSDCLANWCPAGQTHMDDMCVPCGIGRYRAMTDDVCLDCPPGTTTFTDVSGSFEDCTNCASGMFIQRLSEMCAECPVNTYQAQDEFIGESCTNCPSGSTTTGMGSDNIDDCDCDSGRVLTGMACTPCGIGRYRTKGVHTTCQDCPAGETTTSPTAASAAECQHNHEGGGWCGAGQEFRDGMCQPCRVSYYKPADATMPMCLECPTGLSTTTVGSTDLACCIDVCGRDGYQYVRSHEMCLPCGIGRFKTSAISPLCMDCPAGTTTRAIGSCSMFDCIAMCSRCVDLVIVIDISDSSDADDLTHIKIFLIQLANLFHMTPKMARIGIIRYASTAFNIITLEQGTSAAAVEAKVNANIQISGDSMVDTASALMMARNMIMQSGRPNAVKHVLLMTDDMLSNPTDVTTQADMIKNMMVTLSVIGLDDSMSVATSLANFFSIHDFQTLPSPALVLHSVC